MTRRSKAFLMVLVCVIVGCLLAVEVDAYGEGSYYAPAWQPHDEMYLSLHNNHPFDTYEFLVTVYDGDFQFVTSGYYRVLPDDYIVEISEGWCAEVGGLSKLTIERVDSEATDDFYVGGMFRTPCAGDAFFRVFLPLLGS